MAAALKLQAESLENKKESFSIVQIAEVVEQLHRLFDATNGPSSNKHKKTKDKMFKKTVAITNFGKSANQN